MARLLFTAAAGPASIVLALVGLAAVTLLSLPELDDRWRGVLGSTLVLIWLIYIVQMLVTALTRVWGGSPVARSAMIIDLLAVIVPPSGLLILLSRGDESLFCSVWVLKLLQHLRAFQLMARVFANEARNLLGVLALFGIVLFLAALVAHVAERSAQPELFGSIPKAMWWAVVTLTTTGYGDAIPQSVAGRVLAGLVMMCGIAVFALWAGILATGFAEEIRRQNFIRIWKLVAAVPIFGNLGPAGLAQIVQALKPRNVPAGATICRKGQPGDEMYFILDGRVRVDAPRPIELGPGDYFGEIALITGEPRSATVAATTTVALLSLHISDFQLLIGRDPGLADVIRRTAEERRGAGANV